MWAGWEIAVSECTTNRVQEVDVQSLVSSSAESCLHGDLISVRSPLGVDRVISGNKSEADSVRS